MKIPEYDVSILKKGKIRTLKDSKDNTSYYLGDYTHFLKYYKEKYNNNLQKLEFNFDSFYVNFADAVKLRNRVAHVGKILNGYDYKKLLLLLFGKNDDQNKQTPVFESICKLSWMVDKI